MIIGREDAATARRLVVGILLTAVCWSAADPSAADGIGPHGLTLEVTVNTRPGLGALHPGIRTGAVVVKSYRLVNRSGADLRDVRVRDLGMPGAAIRCPGGLDRVPMLTGLRSVRCTATGAARPGAWIGKVLAAGQQRTLRATVQATARSGYAGVGAALDLSETARVTGPEQAEVRYVLVNNGNRPVHGVRITDPALAPHRIACAGGRPVVGRLAAGARAACIAVVRRSPGTYVSRGQADGSDLLRTLDPRGGPVAPPRLTARATARFTLRAPVPAAPVTPRPRTTVVPGAHPRVEPPAPLPPPAALHPLAALLPPAPTAPGITAPGIAPPAVGPRLPDRPDGARQDPAPRPPATQPPAAVPKQARPPRSLLGRFIRQDHVPTGLGMLAALLLVLLPAAVAAAVFGSRRL
ncbi:hypothetical protein [Streptomyces beijiangensis]|uniref:DUF11 domain-containing protein n=1 Tax=Streptomyces beijiangensis TaxID=163361 RepID=A0A939JGE4_9ACTN|nr:hypothetical protein [Streptomyces beijiangensis]MBO0510424.1 hypothetical protein [Streptomyces beijiangensis]